MYDVVIVGAGPIGLAAAIEAKRRDLRALVIEKGALVNSFLGYPLHLEFFSTPELMEIGGHPFPTMGPKPMRKEAIEYYRRVAQVEELPVRLYERVVGLEGEDGAFEVVTERGRHACRKVVVATGFFDVPNLLDVPGEDLPKVTHYFREPYPYTGQRVAVVGARNSAAKAALSCHRQGAAEVTLVVRGEALSDRIKYWIRPDLKNRIAEGSIRALFRTTVTAVTPEALHLETPDGPREIANDWVLAMTGYRPDYPFLQALGIDVDEDTARSLAHDPDTFETNRPGLYLAGTVCGGLDTSRWFIENGREHARIILEHIATGVRRGHDLLERRWQTAE